MKKILIAVALVASLALVACDNNDDDPTAAPATEAPVATEAPATDAPVVTEAPVEETEAPVESPAA